MRSRLASGLVIAFAAACAGEPASLGTATQLSSTCTYSWPCWNDLLAAHPECAGPTTTDPCVWPATCAAWVTANCVACPGVDTTDPFVCTPVPPDGSGSGPGGGTGAGTSMAAALLVSKPGGTFTAAERTTMRNQYTALARVVSGVGATVPSPGTWRYPWIAHPYVASCHDGVAFTLDLALAAGETVRILDGDVVRATFTAADNGSAVVTPVMPVSRATRLVFEYDVPVAGTPPAVPTGFSATRFTLSASGPCDPVELLGTAATVRVPIAALDGADAQGQAITAAIPGAIVERDGVLTRSQAVTLLPAPPRVPRYAFADPWNFPAVTSEPRLVNHAGSTAPVANAWDQHLGGHPGVVVLQIDDRLQLTAEQASGDYPLPALYFYDDKVAGTGNCTKYTGGACDPFPASPVFSHSSLVAAHLFAHKNGQGWSGVSPLSTRWHAGLGANIFALDADSYQLLVSEFVGFLNTIDPADLDVITMSAGTALPTYAMQAAVARHTDAGVIFVAATGNECADQPLYPAAFPSVIAVGSSSTYDPVAGTFTDAGKKSRFYRFDTATGTWTQPPGSCSNEQPDLTAVGVGPMPVPYLLASVCQDGATLCDDATDCTGIGTGVCLPEGTPHYFQFPLFGTSFATPQVAGAIANTLAEIRFRHPTKYPSLAGLTKAQRAQVVRAAILGGARDLGVAGFDDETGWGQVDHLAALDLLQAAELPSWIPGLRTEHVADLEENVMDDVNAIVGPTTTTRFDVDVHASVGACGFSFLPFIVVLFPPAAILFQGDVPFKIVLERPEVEHRVTGYQHTLVPGAGGRLDLGQSFRQEATVTITVKTYGLFACLLPFVGPSVTRFDVSFAPTSAPGITTAQGRFALGGLGYDRVLHTVARPDYELDVQVSPSYLQPFLDLVLAFFEDEIAEVEELLEEHVVPAIELEAVDMIEDALDVTPFHERLRPMAFFEQRFAPTPGGYGAPVMKHWDPLSIFGHGYLAPTGHLDSTSHMVLSVPTLATSVIAPAHVKAGFPAPYVPPMTGEDADLTSYQSTLLVDYMLNLADRDRYHDVALHRITTTSEDVADLVVELRNLRVADRRMRVNYYAAPTATGAYGDATLYARADLYTCAPGALDAPATATQPCGSVGPPAFRATIAFELRVELLRKNVYAAADLSEIGAAGAGHRFELRETPDWRTVDVHITAPAAWPTIEAPIAYDVTRAELELLLEHTYAPRLYRLFESVSYDRWGLHANLGVDRLTLAGPIGFLSSYVADLIINEQYDGYDLDLGTFDRTQSSPTYALLGSPGLAPAFATRTDLDQGGGTPGAAPSASSAINQESITIHYGRCDWDQTVECRVDADCPGGPCGNRHVCADHGQPVTYPRTECYLANGAFGNPACTGPGMDGTCELLADRVRHADRWDLAWNAGAGTDFAESRDDVYFTAYQSGGTMTSYLTDLWQLTTGAGAIDAVLVPLREGDLARTDPRVFDVIGFIRHPLSLVRVDQCLHRYTATFTYDRLAPADLGPDGVCGTPDDVRCSVVVHDRRRSYRLAKTSSYRDTHLADHCMTEIEDPEIIID